jgi:anti-repressor protein
VIERDGEPWFVAKDVAELLGYAQPADAIRVHCKGVDETQTPSLQGGLQRTEIIPERDVYRLIMRSKLPNAEQFEEWVVGTVLPSIRKHGGYIAQQETLSPEEIIAKALVVAQRVIEEKAARIAQLEPVAAVADSRN